MPQVQEEDHRRDAGCLLLHSRRVRLDIKKDAALHVGASNGEEDILKYFIGGLVGAGVVLAVVTIKLYREFTKNFDEQEFAQ